MNLQEANITDIVRCSQRDEALANELKDYFLPLLKIFGHKTYHQLEKFIYPVALLWYYTLTSLGNLQTLGEEYTGLIRTRGNKLPTKTTSILWLIAFMGGDTAFDVTLQTLRKKVDASVELTENAKKIFIEKIDFVNDNKHIFVRMHHSIFYINGRYQNISNRLTSVRYTLTRDWINKDKDHISTESLRFLGYLSLFYLIMNLGYKVWTAQKATQYSANDRSVHKRDTAESIRIKTCVLCIDNRQGTSATPCGHLFCWDCIQDSLRYQPYCPVCRESVNCNRIVLLQNYS